MTISLPFTKSVVLSFLVFSGLLLNAQNIQITSLSFPPPAATSCTNTFIDINTTLLCINASHAGNTVTVSGSTITIDVDYTIGPICLGAISMPTHNVNLGMLAGGTYSVVVNGNWNASTLSTMSTPLTVTTCCPAVPSFTVSNDTICIGDTVAFGNTSTGSISHEWFENNVSVGTATDYGKRYSTPGTYDIKLVVTDGSCSDSLIKSVLVSNYPTLDLGIDTTICTGTTFQLNAGVGRDSLRWSNNSTNPLYTVNNAGLHHVVVYENGCATRDSVNVGLYVPTYVHIGPDTAICDGENVTLDAATLGIVGYTWQDNSTLPTITVNTEGTYWVIAEDGNGCETRDSVEVEVHPLPVVDLGNDTVICDGETLLLDVTHAGGTYQWQDNSTAPTFTVQAAGMYSVNVTDANGCVGTDEINVTYDPCGVGIEAIEETAWLIYPNPVTNLLSFQLRDADINVMTLRILDYTGREVYLKANPNQASGLIEMDLGTLKTGVYFLEVNTKAGPQLQRFVKK